MTSAAQVSANRSNAQKSTGPRTPEGKAVVAQNAVKHGLLAQEVVIKGEDPEEFELYREGMLAELAPAGLMESLLAERIVGLSWRLRRAERLQAAAFDKVEEKNQPLPVLSPEDASWLLEQIAERGMKVSYPVREGPAVGRRAVQDFAQERILDRLLMYERRIEHSLYRTMAELRNLRKERREEGEKVRKSEGQTVSPSSVPTSSPSPSVSPLPDGVATNVPDAEAEEPSCETNPISVGSGENQDPCVEKVEEVGRGRPTRSAGAQGGLYEEPPCSVSTNAQQAERQSCETNPIGAGAKKGQVGYRPIFRRRR